VTLLTRAGWADDAIIYLFIHQVALWA